MIKGSKTENLGICFYGGGMRAIAYVGILKAFEESNIRLSAIGGSSGGAMVAAPYALGKSITEMVEHARSFKPWPLINPIHILYKKWPNYSALEKYYSSFVPLGTKIEDAQINLMIHSTNKLEKKSEWITNGEVIPAVIASNAFVGSYKINEKVYIDGDYIPDNGSDKLRELGAERTIFCYISAKSSKIYNYLPYNITQETAMQYTLDKNPPDFKLEIKLNGGGLVTKQNFDENFRIGYETGVEFVQSYLN